MSFRVKLILSASWRRELAQSRNLGPDLSTSPSADGYAQDDMAKNMKDDNMSRHVGITSGGKKIQYFDILKKSLLMTWNNKFLWLFGLFIFLGSLTSNMNTDIGSMIDQEASLKSIENFADAHPEFFGSLSITLFFLMIVFFLLRIIGIAAIIKSVNDINLYKQLKIRTIFQEAKSYLSRILLLEMAIGFTLIIIVAVLAIPVIYLFALNAKFLGYLTLTGAVAIVLPLIVLGYYLRRYAVMYIVLGNAQLRVSMESAYVVFAKYIKESLLMGLISVAMGMVLFMTLMAAGLLLIVALSPFGLVAYLVFAKTGVTIIAIVFMTLMLAMTAGLFSWYEAFLQGVWVFFFQEIALEKQTEKKVLEKVEVEGEVPNPETV